jgi:16S rRNA (uracil1498-N3)-methyltransferase
VIRLYGTEPLTAAARAAVTPEQAHYLVNVMRLSVGDELLLFNGRDGEWKARVAAAG